MGSAGTKLLLVPSVLTIVPAVGLSGGLVPEGWRAFPALYAGLLLACGLLVLFVAPLPDRRPALGRSTRELLAPLKSVRMWRFSLYYVVVFGAYVALANLLPKYYVDNYGPSLKGAALLTASFIFPASLLRPLGGYLSDRFGPRVVTYAVFLAMIAAFTPLAAPNSVYMMAGGRLGLGAFAALIFVVGCAMGIGKASIYKDIPNYFPNDVGAVGGLVGMLGALGGFALPPLFGAIARASGSPRAAFLALFVPTVASLLWLHIVVVADRAKRAARRPPYLNGLGKAHRPSTSDELAV